MAGVRLGLAAAVLIGCPSAPPELTCPEGASPREVVPVQGGRAVYCERRNGSRNGPFVEYRPDGTRWKEGTYLGVRKEGTFTWYHPNGRVAERSEWKFNQLDGERVTWDESGVETARERWREGVRIEPPP